MRKGIFGKQEMNDTVARITGAVGDDGNSNHSNKIKYNPQANSSILLGKFPVLHPLSQFYSTTKMKKEQTGL